MIEVVRVAGGLANKMFHCAFALALSERGFDVYIDSKSQEAEFEHDKLELSRIFPFFELKEMPAGMYKHHVQAGIKGKLFRRLPLLSGERYYISHSHRYDPNFIEKIKSDGYIIGFFQNERYFKDCDHLRENLKFAPIEGKQNILLAQELMEENSVSLHVRKGDGYSTWAEFRGTCPLEYYQRAVNYIRARHADAKFYVFTDSVEWVRENLNWLEYKMVDWNPCVGWGNHFDMQLMSLCKHNIIANSTYSWWGAWLNRNPDKMVIAPANWFNLKSRVKEQSDIVPHNWIKLQ